MAFVSLCCDRNMNDAISMAEVQVYTVHIWIAWFRQQTNIVYKMIIQMTSQLLAFVDKMSSKKINEKAKSEIKLEFDYSVHLKSIYVILYLGCIGTLRWLN